MAPAWEELAEKKTKEYSGKVKFGNVNCVANGDLCSEHEIMAYPVLQWYNHLSVDRLIKGGLMGRKWIPMMPNSTATCLRSRNTWTPKWRLPSLPPTPSLPPPQSRRNQQVHSLTQVESSYNSTLKHSHNISPLFLRRILEPDGSSSSMFPGVHIANTWPKHGLSWRVK